MSRAKSKRTKVPAVAKTPIEKLYADLGKAHTGLQSVPEGNDRLFSRRLAACERIAGKIVGSPAQNFDDIFRKICIAGWSINAPKDFAALDNWQPEGDPEQSVLVSVREDLRRFLAQFAAIGMKPHFDKAGRLSARPVIAPHKVVSRGQK